MRMRILNGRGLLINPYHTKIFAVFCGKASAKFCLTSLGQQIWRQHSTSRTFLKVSLSLSLLSSP